MFLFVHLHRFINLLRGEKDGITVEVARVKHFERLEVRLWHSKGSFSLFLSKHLVEIQHLDVAGLVKPFLCEERLHLLFLVQLHQLIMAYLCAHLSVVCFPNGLLLLSLGHLESFQQGVVADNLIIDDVHQLLGRRSHKHVGIEANSHESIEDLVSGLAFRI